MVPRGGTTDTLTATMVTAAVITMGLMVEGRRRWAARGALDPASKPWFFEKSRPLISLRNLEKLTSRGPDIAKSLQPKAKQNQ
jgi:hypothetical protein